MKLITFRNFESILARDLNNEEIAKIAAIKATMSFSEEAGYSPEEQKKREDIKKICGNKIVHFGIL